MMPTNCAHEVSGSGLTCPMCLDVMAEKRARLETQQAVLDAAVRVSEGHTVNRHASNPCPCGLCTAVRAYLANTPPHARRAGGKE